MSGSDRSSAAHPALSFHQVTVRYTGTTRPALERCDFVVHAGERVALLGPNGSGKTTILTAAVGLVPHTGVIRVCGITVEADHLARVRESIGFLFALPEDQLLFPRVLDDVAFSLETRGVSPGEARQSARSALAALDAEELAERSPYRLSRGERLRVALAGILVGEPPLLLLDEPSGSLDAAGRRLLVSQLNRSGAAMLIATHDLGFARQVCGRYVLLEGGRVIGSGTRFDEVEP